MISLIIGGIFVILGLIIFIQALIKKEISPSNLYGISKEKYIVTNKETFTKIMIRQNYICSIYIMFLGILLILTKESILASCGAFIMIIQLICSHYAKRYVEIL
ncbi:hypothetical protein [Clostridium senegalense]